MLFLYLPTKCSFFNLLIFFAAVPHSCLALSLRSVTFPSSFLQSSYLASFSPYLFRLPPPTPYLLS